MPGLEQDARQIINTIAYQIRDQYGPGSVLKELIQNADDAGAHGLAVIGLPGLIGSANPLLQAPGILVANDGAVSRSQLTAMTRASGSDKAGDVAKAGRFGLGQKSLFNLCDAFVVQGWLGDDGGRVEHRIVNPFVALDAVDEGSTAATWETFVDADRAALAVAFTAAGFAGQGTAIYIPLRSPVLRPAPGAGFSTTEPDMAETLANYASEDALGVVAAALRNLTTIRIGIGYEATFAVDVRPGGERLNGPSAGDGFRRQLRGAATISPGASTVLFCGEEHQLPGSSTASFTEDPRWPSTINEHHRRIPEKAAAHAALVLARAPAARRSAIHIHWAVFLPIAAVRDVVIPLDDPSVGRLDLLLHGYFFVDSGRRSISFEGNDGDRDHKFRAEWNAMVRREATLPLLFPTILRAFDEVGFSASQRRTIARAMSASSWWTAVSDEAAGSFALAECLSSSEETAWIKVERSALRPLPRIDQLPVSGLIRLFPRFRDWTRTRSLIGAFDAASVLASAGIEWDAGELAALLETLEPRTLQRTDAAEQLAVFLASTLRASRPNDAGAALVAVLRRALSGDALLAGAQAIAKIAEFVPPTALFPLPRSVENRSILRALAMAGGTVLAVRPAFAPTVATRSIDVTTTIDWLASLEDLVGQPGDLGDQANVAVAAIIAAGPSLAELVDNERARHLRVVRARRVGGDDYEILTLSELVLLSDSGRLFSSQPGDLLRKVAAAVPGVAMFIIRLSDDNAAAGKLRLQSPSAPAASEIVRAAVEFGGAYERGQLLGELLRDDGIDRQVLRALCVGEPVGGLTGVELLSLAGMPEAFSTIAMDAVSLRPLSRVIPQVISDHFSNAVRSRLGVREIELDQAASMIVEAHAAGTLRPRSSSEAEDILRSGIEWTILSRLPVFASTMGMVAIDAPLFREDAAQVPPSMRRLVAVLQRTSDPMLRSIHARVSEWTAVTQIDVALSQPDPAAYAHEVLDGLQALADHEISALRSRLRSTAWMPGPDGKGLRGEDVLTLDPVVDAELRAILPSAPFVPFDQLPAMVREHPASTRLRGSIFATPEESLEALALQLDAEPWLIGSVVDPIVTFEDLVTLAKASAALELPAWPLLAAVLRSSGDPQSSARVLTSLTGIPSSSSELVSHMNSLSALFGSGPRGEAARRVHRSAFSRYETLLVGETGWLPGDLLLPSRSGIIRRADALAPRGRGLSATHELDRLYSEGIAIGDETRGVRRADGRPELGEDAELAPDAVRSRLADTLRDLLEPWRRAVPSDAIVFLLGLLGRDPAMQSLAREWETDTRSGSYEDIWAVLDGELASHLGQDDLEAVLARTVFTAEVVTDRVEVQSAAGTSCVVPLAADHAALIVGNPLGSRRSVLDAAGRTWHHVDLAFVERPPTSLHHDRPLFRALVELICPTVLLALRAQKEVVLACFARAFEIDQVTIEDTIAKLRDQSPTLVRTLVVPDAGVVRSALVAFERVSPIDAVAIEAAKATLWGELQAEGAAEELLTSVRSKIAQMGYAPVRVFFELLQNADDAYVQIGAQDGRLLLEIDADANGLPLQVRIVHWGRPINHPGSLEGVSGVQGYQNDLYNMLAINHSEKSVGTGTTGKFGLGFKTIHMITRNARVASGFVGASIVGGMIPQEWPEGIELVRARADGVVTATLLDIPIDPDHAVDALSAIEAFLACAEWLPAIAGRIRHVEVADATGDRHFSTRMDPVVGTGLSVIRNRGHRERRALRLDLDRGFSMLIAIGRSGPEAIVASSSIWNLVPLEEQATSRWLINGPFDVDPGRSHIKGSPEQQAATFGELGASLGDRLVELFDLIANDATAFAELFDMEVASLGTFWANLTTFFEPDLAFHREVRLHYGDRGLGRLWAQRPAIGTGLPGDFGRPLRAGDVSLRTAHALAVPAVFLAVADWPAMRATMGSIVSEQVGIRLMNLAIAISHPLTLRELVGREIGSERRVTVDIAERLGSLLTRAGLETFDLQPERSWLLAELRTTLFLSREGSWVEVGRLAFETGEDDVENLRAGFAPDGNVLSRDYGGAALEFFRTARSSSGFGPNAFVMRTWAEQATDPVKRTAFLRYLLSDHAFAVEVAMRPVSWLPSPLSGLRGHILLIDWTALDVTLLLALFQQIPPDVPPPVDDDPPEPYDPLEFLEAIHEWWLANGVEEAVRYDELTYPADFDFELLRDGERTAWFTMFALAIFQNLGRTQDQQGRSFVETAIREGWWADLATFALTADVDAWIDRLNAWSDPDAGDQTFLIWRRCLVDLYAVAKYLPEYTTLVRALPGAIAEEGVIALQSLMRPYQSAIAARLGVTAPSIDRSIGMGLNWLIRELVRHDVFDAVEAAALHPYGWTASARARRLLAHGGMELPEPGRMDESRFEFDEISTVLDPARAIFEGDLDLPLQLLGRQDFLGKLVAALVAYGLDPSLVLMEGDDD